MKPSSTFTLEILFSFSQSFTLTGCNCSPSGHADNETTCFPYCSGHWEPDPHHPHLVHSQPPGQNQFHIFMMYKLFVTLTPEPIFSKLFNFFCATASFYSSSVNLCLFLAFHRKFTDPWQNQYLDSTKIIQELNTSEVLSQTETQFSIKNGRSKSVSSWQQGSDNWGEMWQFPMSIFFVKARHTFHVERSCQ